MPRSYNNLVTIEITKECWDGACYYPLKTRFVTTREHAAKLHHKEITK